MTRCAVLTYHSQNVHGDGTADNDHVALREDLEALHAAGRRILSLSGLADWLDGKGEPEGTVCLSFDDGCDFDARDLEFPGHGPQRSFLGILQDFLDSHGDASQPGLHATSFVIASAKARRMIDERSLFGKGWISDDWWRRVTVSPLMSIGNHGWDHNHPDLGEGNRGSFTPVDNPEDCELQVIRAARYIEETAGAWPRFFAYPFGQSSDFIRQEFFPRHAHLHRCRAAFGTRPGKVTTDSDRWNLPRYVCGRDWKTPEALLKILDSG